MVELSQQLQTAVQIVSKTSHPQQMGDRFTFFGGKPAMRAKHVLQDQLEPAIDEEVIATAGMDIVASVKLVPAYDVVVVEWLIFWSHHSVDCT